MTHWTTDQAAQSDISGNSHLHQLRNIAASFRLLADETRLRVLSLLIQNGEMNVRSLCHNLEQSQPAVSHHLALLRAAGLVRSRRDGKNNFYRCVSENLDAVIDIRWREVMVPTDNDTMAMLGIS